MQREYLGDREGLPGAAGSVWLERRERPARPRAEGRLEADVVVVGGGMTGTLTALRLANEGADVILLEGRRLHSDVTGHTTAKATAQHGLLTANLPEAARLPWLAENLRAVDRLEALAESVGGGPGGAGAAGDSTFARTSSVLYTTTPEGVDALRRELDLYRQLELDAAMVDGPLPPGVTGAVRLERQGMLHPVDLLDALLDAAVGRGSAGAGASGTAASAPAAGAAGAGSGVLGGGSLRVFEGSMVRSVDEESAHVTAETDHALVRARALVSATHMPFFDTLMYVTRLFQYRTYALEIEVANTAPEGMWYSEDEPNLSWRPVDAKHPQRLVVSGVEHKAGQGGDERRCYAALEAACSERFGELKVLRHWSTQDPVTPDGLPLIGRMIGRDHCLMATGYNGWGMTSSEVAAEILVAEAAGRVHILRDLVSPLRVGTSGLVTLAVENADVVAQAFSAESVPSGSPEQIALDQGLAMRVGTKHVAVARDADGTLHALDAHCSHMRCGVEYNEAEGTWDCPCHGSRFYANGDWLHGPAKRPLERVDLGGS